MLLASCHSSFGAWIENHYDSFSRISIKLKYFFTVFSALDLLGHAGTVRRSNSPHVSSSGRSTSSAHSPALQNRTLALLFSFLFDYLCTMHSCTSVILIRLSSDHTARQQSSSLTSTEFGIISNLFDNISRFHVIFCLSLTFSCCLAYTHFYHVEFGSLL